MLGDIFKNKDVWIFDLDNTLYSSKTKIFDQIDERMKLFISKKLNISFEKAFTLQKKFYKEYGTTLYGLMKHYNFQPKEFLNFVHDVNLDKITKNKNLFENIKNLPGEKIIYTNGDENYARRVLKKLGIHKLFSYILDIERSNYIPKPIIDPLISFLEEKRINLNNCVYFEDLQKNLENAHKYGITTIHIKEKDFDNIKIESFIDFRFSSLIKALKEINKNFTKGR
jgi:putative hydrolase of the HAD superfamily